MKRLLLLFILPAIVCAQGQLTPPAGAFSGGAPAPSMKSLDQIEPRIPLTQPANSTAGLTISAPGSYYLTGNVTVASGDAITITASNVTLDLNGFTLATTATSFVGNAISIQDTRRNIIVRNGVIDGNGVVDASSGAVSGSGFRCGILCDASMSDCLVSHVNVRGVGEIGIYLDENSTIDHCVAEHCGNIGLRAQVVTHSSARFCNSGILGNVLADCYATSVGSTAIGAYQTATNCYGESRKSRGLNAQNAVNCQGYSQDDDGLFASTATNCRGRSNAGAGLVAKDQAVNCRGETYLGAAGLIAGDITVTPNLLGAAENCVGLASGGTGAGLIAGSASGCRGTSTAGIGLQAVEADGCHGFTTTGNRGLIATRTATGCTGEITTATCPVNAPVADSPCGLFAATAENCTGTIATATGRCFGLFATTATNCTGTIVAGSDSSYSSAGLAADTATGCRGECPHCPGLGAIVATNSCGYSTNSWGLSAATANNCYGSSTNFTGLKALGSATGCRGRTGGTGSVYAIEAAIAVACTAESGTINASSKQLGTP